MPRAVAKVTYALAARHEALWLKLTALQAQVGATAARRPQVPVSAQTAKVAEALLREGLPFLANADPLPMVAPDAGGLATQLGQALAGLDIWEATNIAWRSDLNAFVWKVGGDTPLPVQRLRPRMTAGANTHADPDYAAYQARMAELRSKLAKRIEQFRNR